MIADRTWNLMAQRWAGQLAAPEAAELDAWVAGDPRRVHVVRDVAQIMDRTKVLRAADDAAAAWERLRLRMHDEAPRRQAARALRLSMDARDRADGGGPSRPHRRAMLAALGIAAALVAAVGVMQVVQRTGVVGAAPMHEYATRRGEQTTVDLPDGSRVTLGPQSSLGVALSRFRRERTLQLRGIAHFAVAHDPSHPFTVVARGTATQAVGTAFVVRAYANEPAVQVVVAEGRVLIGAVQGAPGSRALLAAGDLGRVRAGGVASVEHGVDVERYLGWMQHRLVYSLVPAQEIARDLERWYDLTIVLDPRLRGIRVTTTLDPAGAADDAVRRLATLLNAQYERTGTQVRVYRNAPAAPASAPTPRDSVERT